MKNVKKLLLALALIAAAILSAPKTTLAAPWCMVCEQSGYTDCFACCKCDGGSTGYCAQVCPW
jgi:hypothetical protein